MTNASPPEPVPPTAEGAPSRRRRTRVRRWFAVLGVGVLVVAVLAGATVTYLANRYDRNVKRIPNVFASIPPTQRPPVVAPKAMNILLVGSDSRAPVQTTGSAGNSTAVSPIGQRSDTIMLLHLAGDRKSAWVVSIPRDSWVPIPGRGEAKINAAYAYGGPSLLVNTVEQLTGVSIDHYAEIDFAGLQGMTDAVGGVDVSVGRAFAAGGYNLTAGVNHLDGQQALAFVRQRSNLPNGDFDRILNQQAYLKALMAKATSLGVLSDPVTLTRLLDAVTRSISFDSGLSGADLRSLAFSLRSLRPESVRFLTMPVRGTGWVGDQSVVFLDPAKDAALTQALRTDRMDQWRP